MYLAIDIGGTKTLLATFNAHGTLKNSVRFETPKDYSEFLTALTQAFEGLKPESPFTYCVAGAPGMIDRATGNVKGFGNLDWTHIPLTDDLKKITGLPVSIENDANLAGLSEAILVQHSFKKVLYITVSTGIGGVLVVNGTIDPETADMEFGHMTMEHEGRLQKWQEFASGKAIFAKYGKKASDIPAEDTGAWYKISRNIALGLNPLINIFTPDAVIVGGGVGTHFAKFGDRLHEELMIFGNSLVSVPPLRQALRAEEAVIYGCYEYARQQQA
jgi:glucokinase